MGVIADRFWRWSGRWWWPSIGRGEFAGCDVVVAHEWLTSVAGSDKVAAELVTVSNASALVCLAASSDVVDALGIGVPVHQCRLGPWASSGRRWQLLLPLMPWIWASADVAGVGTLLVSSHSLVNSIRRSGRRVCYCHTPVRYGWEWRMERRRLPWVARPLWRPAAAVLRAWDRRTSTRVDVFVADSAFVADRIERFYGRASVVIHPPVDTERFVPGAQGRTDEFLVAGRLVAYKRFDVAVAAAVLAGVALVVAGDGPDWERLRRLAGPSVRFVRAPSDDELVGLMQSSKALVFPGVEDFGMIVVEAQACGAPVIARAAGGALESVDPSGVLVDSERVEEWARVLASFVDRGCSADRRTWAQRFSPEVFRRQMRDVLASN